LIAVISCPLNIMVPFDACCKPAAIVSNVLFPEPDAPASAVISPLFKERLIPFKTCSSTSPFVNDFRNVSAVNSAILHLSLLNGLYWFVLVDFNTRQCPAYISYNEQDTLYFCRVHYPLVEWHFYWCNVCYAKAEYYVYHQCHFCND